MTVKAHDIIRVPVKYVPTHLWSAGMSYLQCRVLWVRGDSVMTSIGMLVPLKECRPPFEARKVELELEGAADDA